MKRALLVLGCSAALCGCTNPDATVTTLSASRPPVANVGEPSAAPPASPSSQAPAQVQRTPQTALRAFARLYIDWNYRTLTRQQQTLASISVGPARFAEEQAAASSHGDGTLSGGRIFNRGQVAVIGPSISDTGAWVVVTREQTGGDSQYEGLPASYHVTLARLARVQGGWAVSEWLPQD